MGSSPITRSEMRKIYIDGGAWYGDTIEAFLGVKNYNYPTPSSDYPIKPRSDAAEYEIYAFEVSDDCLKKLRELKYPNLRIIEKAMWVEDGEVDFRTDESSMLCSVSMFRLLDNNFPIKPKPCLHFSKWFAETCKPEDYIVLKLDVEGSEIFLLKDLIDKKLDSWINELYVEYHYPHQGVNGMEEVREYLDNHFRNLPSLVHYDNLWL